MFRANPVVLGSTVEGQAFQKHKSRGCYSEYSDYSTETNN